MEYSMNHLWMVLLGLPGIIVATTVHEFTRAAVSAALGDTYPKSQGKLTLNPIKHFEPIGFLLMLYTGGFGWGKPVETSGLYYKNRKRDTLLTAILPSVVNLVLGIIFLGVSHALSGNAYVTQLFHYLCYYNVGIAVYNVLPVVPMDCVKVLSVLMPANQYFKYMQHEKLIQMIFLILLFLGQITGFMNMITAGVIALFGGLFGVR